MAGELTWLVKKDPIMRRSLKVNQEIALALKPYNEIQKILTNNSKQTIITLTFLFSDFL